MQNQHWVRFCQTMYVHLSICLWFEQHFILMSLNLSWWSCGISPHMHGRFLTTADFLIQVFACAKPFLDKTLAILVEGLVDTLLSLFDENQDKELRLLDANGFCQLMIEVNHKTFMYTKCIKYYLNVILFVSSCQTNKQKVFF